MTTFEFQYTEEDLLTHQLFLASQSSSVRKRRAKGKMFLMLIYMGLGLFIWSRNGPVAAAAYFILCLPLYFLYAYMEKKQFERHFRTAVQSTLKEYPDQKLSVTFNDQSLQLRMGEHENIIPIKEITDVSELTNIYSFSTESGQSFYIPKKISNSAEDATTFIPDWSRNKQVAFSSQLAWRWK